MVEGPHKIGDIGKAALVLPRVELLSLQYEQRVSRHVYREDAAG